MLAALLRALVAQDKPDLTGLLEQTFSRLRSVLGVELVVFAELEGGEARLVGAAGSPEVTALLPRERFPVSRLGFLGSQAWLREPYWIEVVSDDLPQPTVLQTALGEPVRSVAAVPLLLGPGRTGLIAALGLARSPVAAEDLSFMVRVGDPLRSLYRRYHGFEGELSEEERLRHIAALTGCPRVDLEADADPELLQAIGGTTLLRYRVYPLADLGEQRIRAAVSNPLDWRSLDDFESISGYRITERCLAPETRIRERLELCLEQLEQRASEPDVAPDELA
ncbi:MAG TPA: hypothetical protein DEA08_03565, partial [Planctomycetes bacterium]|nr:hypothetical protein [Planctomycetota bacterium]